MLGRWLDAIFCASRAEYGKEIESTSRSVLKVAVHTERSFFFCQSGQRAYHRVRIAQLLSISSHQPSIASLAIILGAFP